MTGRVPWTSSYRAYLPVQGHGQARPDAVRAQGDFRNVALVRTRARLAVGAARWCRLTAHGACSGQSGVRVAYGLLWRERVGGWGWAPVRDGRGARGPQEPRKSRKRDRKGSWSEPFPSPSSPTAAHAARSRVLDPAPITHRARRRTRRTRSRRRSTQSGAAESRSTTSRWHSPDAGALVPGVSTSL